MASCDTSFLCALYLPQSNTTHALAWYEETREIPVVTNLALMEFRHSLRLQAWLHHQDKSKGFPETQAGNALRALEQHCHEKSLLIENVPWPRTQNIFEQLSQRYTRTSGCRLFDLLLIAATLAMEEKVFLTFDLLQRQIAESEGLTVPLP